MKTQEQRSRIGNNKDNCKKMNTAKITRTKYKERTNYNTIKTAKYNWHPHSTTDTLTVQLTPSQYNWHPHKIGIKIIRPNNTYKIWNISCNEYQT